MSHALTARQDLRRQANDWHQQCSPANRPKVVVVMAPKKVVRRVYPGVASMLLAFNLVMALYDLKLLVG